MSALLLIFEPLGSGGPAAPVVVPEVFVTTIYEALHDKFNIPNVLLHHTGFFQERTKFPYVFVSRGSSNAHSNISCHSRIDECGYSFEFFSYFLEEVQDITNQIEAIYDWEDLRYQNSYGRRHTSLHWNGRSHTEIEPGIWYGKVDYLIYSQKTYNGTSEITTGTNFLEVIKNRYNLDEPLFVGYAREGYAKEIPYVCIPGASTNTYSDHSCGRLEQTDFTFNIFHRSLDELEILLEKLIDRYDFAHFQMTNRVHATTEWVGDTTWEKEPGIWQTDAQFLVIQEKEIP